MHIESNSLDNYSIFINNNYIDLDDYSDKDSITKCVKQIVKKIQNRLNLKGFYKLKVYVAKRIGMFVDIIKIDNIGYSNGIDLRVIVYLDEDVYVGVDDYFLINYIDTIRYYNDKYYVKVDDIVDIFSVVEFGKFIYGREVENMLMSSRLV